MTFKDLADQFDTGLDIPIRGTTYHFDPVDAEFGLFLQGATTMSMQIQAGMDVNAAAVENLKLDDGTDLMRRLLGDTLDEMISDGVPWTAVQLASSTVMIWTLQDKAAAEAFWNAGGTPKANRAQKRARGKSARQGSTATTSRKPRKATGGKTS